MEINYRTRSKKLNKWIRWDGTYLYLKTPDGNVRELGKLNTMYGGLTQTHKLKAVMGAGEWVKI